MMTGESDETDFIDTLIHRIAIPQSDEMLEDGVRFDAELAFGIREMTAEESAAWDARILETKELEAAGLLDDRDDQIKPDECPACYDIADSVAAGWNGPLGDYVKCERPRGHEGSHMYKVLWEDNERPHRN